MKNCENTKTKWKQNGNKKISAALFQYNKVITVYLLSGKN